MNQAHRIVIPFGNAMTQSIVARFVFVAAHNSDDLRVLYEAEGWSTFLLCDFATSNEAPTDIFRHDNGVFYLLCNTFI